MDLERQIRDAFDAGELEAAATLAIESYGGEVLGYLLATLRDEEDASEVFSQVSEDLWRGIEDFQWRSTFRTWLYILVRHAAARHCRAPQNQRKRKVPLSRVGEVAATVRSRTLPHLRTEVKDRFAALRETLEPDDQALLILRVNRQLSWKEIAVVFGEAEPDDGAALRKGAARFRQRFQAIKTKIRSQAKRDGLLDSGA
jgi:RNA polymerase sigma-70 factor (ECF subfamily)